MPKMQLSMGARKKTYSATTKRTRLPKMAQTHQDKVFKLISPTPKPAEKKARKDEVQRQLNESIQELTGMKIAEEPSVTADSVGQNSPEEGLIEQILQKIGTGFNPNENESENINVADIAMNVIKMIVPVIIQSVQATVENAVKENLKILPDVNRTNVKYLAEKVNNKALVAKFERDDLQQQGRKDTLRIYEVNCPDDETNEDLLATVVEKISEADIEISQNYISVCHCQGRKQEGQQPILVKFVRRNKRNEVLRKKKDLRNKGVSVQ